MSPLKLKFNLFSTVLFFTIITFSLLHQNLFQIIFVLISLAIHEFTHFLCSELTGYSATELNFQSLSGSLKIDPVMEINPDAEFIIAASGPVSNLLMVGGVFYLKLLGIFNNYLENWLQINLLIGFVNLIPALPLDGGRILHAWLNRIFGLPTAAAFSKWIAFSISLLFLILGIARIMQEQNGAFFILMGLFILGNLFYLKKPAFDSMWKSLRHKQKNLRQKGFMEVMPVIVDGSTYLVNPLKYYGSHKYLLFFLPDKDQKMSIISEETAWNYLIEQGIDATFSKAHQFLTNKTCRILPDEVE